MLCFVLKALIGFVGLGNMGAHMAKNLIKRGHELIVFDVNAQAVKDLTKLGAKPSVSPADLASRTKHIITMLPSHPHVNEVFTSKNGILSLVYIFRMLFCFILGFTLKIKYLSLISSI